MKKLKVFLTIAIIFTPFIYTFCQSSDDSNNNINTNVIKSNHRIKIGVEYGVIGLSEPFNQLGITGVKHFPEMFSWNNMQPHKNSKIDFTLMDKFIKEYQLKGFSDILIALKPSNKWASIGYWKNFSPKKENYIYFEKWVASIVERYDKDGIEDMPDLKYPVNLIEIGIEFSAYEPEPAYDYVKMLKIAYNAAHKASDKVMICHSAFLVGNIFINNPSPKDYEKAFKNGDKRIMYHSLEDIRQILDRPDIFDVVNFHALNYPIEIEQTVKWLKYEMKNRKYNKPIIISDTAVAPLLGYGRANKTKGPKELLPIISLPAHENDRKRLKKFFKKCIAKDKNSIAWVHSFSAQDMVKKILISAEQGIYMINTAFMEEFEPAKWAIFGAAAGVTSWTGMTLTKVKPFNEKREILEVRPSFYAIKQLQQHIKNYDTIERIKDFPEDVRVYSISKSGKIIFIAWYEPGYLVLPEDKIPSKCITISGIKNKAVIEFIISKEGLSVPVKIEKFAWNNSIDLELSEYPQYIICS